MQQITVTGTPPATPLVFGDAQNPVPSLISNQDLVNTVYIGNDPSANPNNPNQVTPLLSGQYIAVTGAVDVYGICSPSETALVYVLENVTSVNLPVSQIINGKPTIYVQPTAPTGTIPVNSIWFNTTADTIETWNGSAWVVEQLNAANAIVAASITASQIANATLTSAQIAAAAGILGSQIANATITSGNIAANTIVAGNIAANTILAANLAAGIIYAGIVNGTMIEGAQFVAYGDSGEILIYAGQPQPQSAFQVNNSSTALTLVGEEWTSAGFTKTIEGDTLLFTMAYYSTATSTGIASVVLTTSGEALTLLSHEAFNASGVNNYGWLDVWAAYDMPGGDTTLTVTFPVGYTNQGACWNIREYTGFGASPVIDVQTASNLTGSTGTSFASGSETSTQYPELWWGAVAGYYESSVTAPVITGPASPWSNTVQESTQLASLTASMNFMTGYQSILDAYGTLDYSGTFASAENWAAVVIAIYTDVAAQPGQGNLIGSWSGQAGTDDFDNSYPAGIDAQEATINGTITSIPGSIFNGLNGVHNENGLFFYGPSSPPDFVQVKAGANGNFTSSHSPATITSGPLPVPSTEGNSIFFLVAYYSTGAETIGALSASIGSTSMDQLIHVPFNSASGSDAVGWLDLWAAYNIPGGASDAIWETYLDVSEQLAYEYFIFEFTDMGPNPIVDVIVTDNDVTGTGTSFTSGSETTTSAVELWLGAVAGYYAASGTAPSITGPASPWTNEAEENAQINSFTSSTDMMAGYQVTTATGNLAYAGTFSEAQNWASIAIAIKPSIVSLSNLLASIAAISGTDPDNNTFPPGFMGTIRQSEPATLPVIPEIWHNVTPPSGWSGLNRYKMLAELNTVRVDVQLTNSSGGSGNITVMTLPSAYAPDTMHNEPLVITCSAAPTSQLTRMEFNTSGTVETSSLPTDTTTIAGTWDVPLD